MEIPFKQKLFYFFPVLFCFCLPFGYELVSPITSLWVLVSFFNLNKEFFLKGFKNKNLWLFWSFFFLTLVSALFSSNKEEALTSIEISMSFLVFPYLFFCFNYPLEILKRCLAAFVSGCFFACLFLIGRALFYTYDGHSEYFSYGFFSYFLHSSYLAMYLILAIAIVVLFYKQWFHGNKSILYSSYFFIAIFTVSVFFSGSRMGIIGFFLCVPLLALYRMRLKLNTKTISLSLLGLVVMVLLFVKLLPNTYDRFYWLLHPDTIQLDKTSSESTAVRILIWEQANNLIAQNFWLGTGIGDANDTLQKAYRENGMTGAFSKNLNAHNQFLQTFIGLGFFGFMLLLVITVGQFIKALAKKRFLLFYFSLLIVLNFLVESMLLTAAGVLFFAFFFCLLNLVNEKKLYAA